MRVLLRPIGTDRRARDHFETSVREGRSFAECRPFLSAEDAAVLERLPEPLRFWGSTPTEQRSTSKARAISGRRPGDVVAFYTGRTFIARGRIAHVMDNPDLARWIWNVDADGETWRHMVALVDVEEVSRPSVSLLDPLSMHDVVRAPDLLSEGESAEFLRLWDGSEPESTDEAREILVDLVGRRITTVTGRENVVMRVLRDNALVGTDRSATGRPVPLSDVQRGLDLLRADGFVRVAPDALGFRSAFVGAVLAALPGTRVTLRPARVWLDDGPRSEVGDPYLPQTDGRREAPFRLEQSRLRRLLLAGRRLAPCDVCGDTWPADLLVAAHIKRRAECTEEERNDVHHVVMLACALGCDALFERSYIAVDPTGTIVAAPSAAAAEGPLGDRVRRLRGRRCAAYTDRSAVYFGYHGETLRE